MKTDLPEEITMLKKNLVALTIAAILVSPLAIAKPGKGGDNNPMKQVLSQLDLSDDQKSEIRELMKSAKAEKKANRETNKAEREDHKEQMRALITADSFDENAAKVLIAERQEKMAEHMLKRVEMHYKIYHLLEPAQQEKFLELMEAQMKSRGEKMRGK
ncbi:Spy/CpxP family protein refolding chaperone [Corallincola platygyrae]|uniref:Spy/CpxP family protein refolding chaperone n=1 Tax=Corallincola platygyrae TaxID=1193278 RepID=A0ABW4XPA9_9GAMM